MKTIRACLFGSLALVMTAAQATVVFSDTSASVTFRYCIAGATSCDSITPIITQAVNGLPGALAASASMPSTPTFGSGMGSVSLSGTVGAPILHASATSVAGARVNTNSFALQQYTYTGSSSTTRSFGGTLTYAQTIVAGGPFSPAIGNGIYATIEIFKLAGGFEAGTTAQSNIDALFDPSTQAGFTLLSSAQFADPDSTAGATETFGTSVTLDPGESVFVWVLLQPPALNGSAINAFDTLVTQWNDSTNLVPASIAAAPEPATFALLGLGLAGLGFVRRKR